jgi:hypothetical protein
VAASSAPHIPAGTSPSAASFGATSAEQKDLERRIDTLLDAFASGALKGPSVQTKLQALGARQGLDDR